jgi:hypothetical protein
MWIKKQIRNDVLKMVMQSLQNIFLKLIYSSYYQLLEWNTHVATTKEEVPTSTSRGLERIMILYYLFILLSIRMDESPTRI